MIEDPEFAAMARKLMEAQARESADAGPVAGAASVPWSRRSAFIACVCAAMLQAGALVVDARSAVEIVPGVGLDFSDGSGVSAVYIGYSLLRGARVAGVSLLIAHHVLRAIGQTSLIAYAAGAAAIGAAQAVAQSLLSHGPPDLLVESVTGLAAGFLFRMLAGVERARNDR